MPDYDEKRKKKNCEKEKATETVMQYAEASKPGNLKPATAKRKNATRKLVRKNEKWE